MHLLQLHLTIIRRLMVSSLSMMRVVNFLWIIYSIKWIFVYLFMKVSVCLHWEDISFFINFTVTIHILMFM